MALVRKSAVAGAWYPGDAPGIAAEISGHLACAGVTPALGRLVGLICPHAGLRYSGPVAAYAYALLAGRRDLSVVLVGPSHRAAFDGVALWPSGAFETPLGQAPIDEEIASAIRAAAPHLVREAPEPHRFEHSLEMQLPFLQSLVPGLRVVPLLMGSQSRGEAFGLAAALGRALAGRPALLVASSDLSHYHPAEVAHALDAKVVSLVERLDPEGLMSRLEVDPGHACGGGPMVAVMGAARALGATRANVLRYGDSGDVGERDTSQVVGYLAAALWA